MIHYFPLLTCKIGGIKSIALKDEKGITSDELEKLFVEQRDVFFRRIYFF
jgi:hypothetical protein